MMALFLILLPMACGGGGGGGNATSESNQDPSTPDSPEDNNDEDENEDGNANSVGTKHLLLRSMTATLAALAQEAAHGNVLSKLAIGNRVAGGLGTGTDQMLSAGMDGDCPAVDYRGATLIMSFDGSPACEGLVGIWEITPGEGHSPEENIFVNEILVIDFSTGDGCLINGEEHSYATFNDGDFSAEVGYDLDVCGQGRSGQVVIKGTAPEHWVFQLDAREYHFDEGESVQVEVDWQLDEGTVSGDGEIHVEGERYDFLADQIRVDPGCALPTAGTLTLLDAAGEMASADFSLTSCEVPVATVSIDGDSEQWTLADRPRG
jgi:hypothetical protein